MKTNRTLLIGIMCGLGCAIFVGLYVAQVNDQAETARAEALARYGGEQLEVLVAKRTLTAGEVIDETSVESKMWLADLLPEEALTQKSEIVGKQVWSTVLKGEVVSARRLEIKDNLLQVPRGLTAISVPARDVQAIGGALEAGMRVDVYATGDNGTGIIVNNALIVDSSTSHSNVGSASSAWVTLAVSPESIQELVTAAQNLQLYFTLPTEDNSSSSINEGDESHE